MDEIKARIEELKARLAELRAGDRTLEAANEITKLKGELTLENEKLVAAEAEAAEIEAAFAEDEAETPAEAPAETPAEAPAAPAAPAEAPAAPATPAEDPADTPAGPVALAASGADASPTAGGDAPTDGPIQTVLTASAGTAGVTAGSQLDRTQALRVLQASHAAGGVITGKTRLFEIDRWGADTIGLHEGMGPLEATARLKEAREAHLAGDSRGAQALVAAGCFCGPDELIKRTGLVGERGRPVAGLFPRIPISGGFRAMPDLAFNVDNLGSVVQWTCADQDAVDPEVEGTWKPCTELDCFTEDTYEPYMVVGCTTVRRQHRWAHPEQVDVWIDLLGIEYDSVAETILLDILEADAGTPLTIGAAGGLMEDHGLLAKLKYALGSLSFSLGYQFREGAGVLERYTVIAPVGFTQAVLADEQIRGFPSGIRTAAEVVSMLEGSYGIRMVERRDEATSQKAAAAATVTALNAGGAIDGATTPLLPPNFRLYVVRTDQWVHGEGTMVGADWHVDDALLRQNKMRYFLENVEGLWRLGPAKTHIIDVPGVILGSYTDLVAPPAP